MLKDGLVEHAPRLVACVAVQLVRLRQQLQVSVDVRHAGRYVVRDGGEFEFKFITLPSNVAKLAADARCVDPAICGEVDEVVFLGRESLELGFRLFLQHLLRADLVVDGGFHQGADGLDELRSERQRLIVPFDGFFYAVDVRVRSVAGVVLHTAAEEVRVSRLRFAVHVHENHAAIGVRLESAPPTPDRALEVVIVLAAALAGVAARIEQFLHTVEDLDVDECFVTTLVVLAPIADLAQIVPVAEHLVDLGVRDRTGRPSGGRPSEESPVGELVGDVLEGHLAAGVEVEGELYERCALFVNRDGVDLSSLDVVGDIEVAQRRPPERPAVHSLLAHLVGHLGAVFRAAVLVEGGEKAVHELPDRGRVDGLGGGDQGHAALAQVCHDDGVVDAVSGEAAEVVDDDRVDVVLA